MSNAGHKDDHLGGGGMIAPDSMSLIDLVVVIAKHKWLIIIFTASVALITLLFLASTIMIPPTSRWNLLPNKYRPAAIVLIQDSSSGGLSSFLGQANANTNALTGLLGGLAVSGKSTSADLAQALLRSRTIEDGVAEKFDFVKKYNITKYPKTEARVTYNSRLKVKFDEKSGLLQIAYEDIDREFATAVVNDITDQLQLLFTGLTTDRAAAKRTDLEKALTIQQAAADGAADRLGAFQKAYGVYDISAQTQASISAVAGLQSELARRQVELDIQRKYLPESDPRIVTLKEWISQLQHQVDQLRTGGANDSGGAISLSQMVGLQSQYATLKTDVQVQQAILLTLKQQLEAAKVAEQDMTPRFDIVERAEVPEIKAAPSRAIIEVISTFVALIIAMITAFFLEYLEKARNNPDEAGKLSAIRHYLLDWKKGSSGKAE